MARRREKPRLGNIGFLRLGLGLRQRLIEPLEFGGARLHAPLQPLVGRGEFLLRQNGLRHVGIGRDDAAVGQPRRADFDHPLGGIETQAQRLFVVEEALDALGDEVVRRSRPVGAARSVEAHDLVEADAEPEHRGRQLEQIGEFAVPGGQGEIAVEHRDALAGMVERVLQLIAARLDRRRGVVEQFERRLARHRAPAQQQREHQPRGRSADRRRQQMLGVADEMRVGLVARRQIEPALAHERLERPSRPRCAEIARDGRLQFAHRRRGAPQAERLRLAARRGADEGHRLHALHRRRLARQGNQNEGGDIGAERKRDAADQRIGRKPDQVGGPKPGDAERPNREKIGERAVGVERRQKQHIQPDERADHHPGDGAARSAAPPNQPAQERRCDLRDRGERQQPDRGEPRAVRQLRVEKAEEQNAEDRRATHQQHLRADFARRRRVGLAGAAMQQDRHDEIVGDGDRERDAVDHHHAGRRREPAEHRRQREAARARGERQRENRQIAVDRAVGESGAARRSPAARRTD